ncbi:MAG: hypothetical protein NVS2B7_04510 [Herpetosiphon sp.]
MELGTGMRTIMPRHRSTKNICRLIYRGGDITSRLIMVLKHPFASGWHGGSLSAVTQRT